MKKLILIGNHIGNYLDLSPRSVHALKTADKIIYEHKVVFDRLINDLQISVTDDLVCFLEISSHMDKAMIADALMNNKNVVFITDAGYPLIADPGHSIIDFLIDNGLDIEVIPGPSISSTALIASGLKESLGDFIFQEFFKFDSSGIIEMIKLLEPLPQTLVIVDFPNRFAESIVALRQILGNRRASFCIELTTPNSKAIRGTLSDIEEYINSDIYDDRLMSTIIISGKNNIS